VRQDRSNRELEVTGPRAVVDVGVPTSGRGTYLAEAISSVLGQTFRDIRVTVGENGPGSQEVADALAPYVGDERLRHIVHRDDLGPAMNFTKVAAGNAPYVALLHDDDSWEPEFLERRVAFLEEHPSCGFVFSACAVIDADGTPVDVWEEGLGAGVHSPEEFLPAIYEHNVVPVPTVLLRRSAYEAVGGTFGDLLFNDHELWLRIGSKFDVGYLSSIDASYRIHGNQTTSAHLRRLGEHRIAFQAAVDRSMPGAVSRAVRRRAKAAARLHVATDAFERGERWTALLETGRAVVSSPGIVWPRKDLRRVSLLVAATLLGRRGDALWRVRRDLGRRRAAAIGARRAASFRARAPRSDPPLFSVVVPARNAEDTIGRTLDSVLIQTCRDLEIIVVDDGSTDSTALIAEQADSCVRVERQENRGVSSARNAGIRLARGRWVSFLDADDLWLPNYLAEMRTRLERDPEPGLVFTDSWVYDEPAARIRRQPMMARRRPADIPSAPDAFLKLLLAGNFVFTSATVPLHVLIELGGYDDELTRAEDYDMWLRIAAAGFRAVYVPGPLALYRVRGGSPGSLSSDRLQMTRGELDVLTRLVARQALPERHSELATERLAVLAAAVGLLERGGAERLSLLGRTGRRIGRVRRDGPLFRRPPPDVAGAFPDLFTPRARPQSRS
jgi:glycosyltransferase involved in cell wall biosynthesis